MITAFDLTAVLTVGLITMSTAVGMGVYLFKQAQASKDNL